MTAARRIGFILGCRDGGLGGGGRACAAWHGRGGAAAPSSAPCPDCTCRRRHRHSALAATRMTDTPSRRRVVLVASCHVRDSQCCEDRWSVLLRCCGAECDARAGRVTFCCRRRKPGERAGARTAREQWRACATHPPAGPRRERALSGRAAQGGKVVRVLRGSLAGHDWWAGGGLPHHCRCVR